MVNGQVRTFAQVGDNIWVGGNFTQVKRRDGTLIDDVSNVAVFDSTTGAYVDIAPKLGEGSTTSNVRGIAVYGDDVVIGGDFAGPPNTNRKNLVVVDGANGVTGTQQPKWFNSERLARFLPRRTLAGYMAAGCASRPSTSRAPPSCGAGPRQPSTRTCAHTSLGRGTVISSATAPRSGLRVAATGETANPSRLWSN